ncbi:hypothetical protein T01_3192 [Trichinella spiralis]|uniref:Uncharacterized protein n=1 Tax=Trichinella spiralis TaxID=6334 RepID=A0A0V1BLJ6_TRISP|nr:hypothetical protein T01_3192 [Trichinella spiralis]
MCSGGGGAADVKVVNDQSNQLKLENECGRDGDNRKEDEKHPPNPSMDDQSTKPDRAQVDRMLRLIFSTQFDYHPPKLDYITNHLENE